MRSNEHKSPQHNLDRIVRFKFRLVEYIGLAFFLIFVVDTAVTELTPILKHIWHTIFGP
ncbi:MAG TPA: hypothetical protein VFQ41_04025 [Candidatus Angelobacter sp.]|nr:hypothetical protein [Candidatus Angelobacter sp.]